MSAAEETITPTSATKRKSAPILNRALDFISSVRLGVFTLCVLVVLSMMGMLIMQANVEGFDAYYVSLTPAEKTVFGALGLFDIYHSWYFYFALLFLSLNLILASIDRFPSAWSYIVKPKLKATTPWLMARRDHEEFESNAPSPEAAALNISAAFKASGMKVTVTEESGVTNIFGESGKWNRLGAYIVHVALLTLFIGHFVFLTTSFDADVRMIPGQKTDSIQLIRYNVDNTVGFRKDRYNVKLPFSMECTDIQQRLINENGSIDVSNTLDWSTRLKIDDPAYGVTEEAASLNKPLFYRGYRFFQAQTIPIGHARTITLELTPQTGGDVVKVEVPRNGSASLADGTKVDFTDFQPDFTMGQNGQPDTRSGDYNNPAAILNVTPPGGSTQRVFAFANKLPDNAPIAAPKAGYKWHLGDFEKAPMAHVLAIKYDPYNASIIAWYVGGFGLVGSLMFVFFLSHKRVWARVERRDDGKVEIVLAGEANRNHLGFSDKFKKIADEVRRETGGLPAITDDQNTAQTGGLRSGEE
jgi:cytochrome c biogenesis protein